MKPDILFKVAGEGKTLKEGAAIHREPEGVKRWEGEDALS